MHSLRGLALLLAHLVLETAFLTAWQVPCCACAVSVALCASCCAVLCGCAVRLCCAAVLCGSRLLLAARHGKTAGGWISTATSVAFARRAGPAVGSRHSQQGSRHQASVIVIVLQAYACRSIRARRLKNHSSARGQQRPWHCALQDALHSALQECSNPLAYSAY